MFASAFVAVVAFFYEIAFVESSLCSSSVFKFFFRSNHISLDDSKWTTTNFDLNIT